MYISVIAGFYWWFKLILHISWAFTFTFHLYSRCNVHNQHFVQADKFNRIIEWPDDCICLHTTPSLRRISENLSESLPNLQSLFLTNNLVQELADLDSLAGLKKLEYVSLLGNPVTTRDHYRLYLINKVPQVDPLFNSLGKVGDPLIISLYVNIKSDAQGYTTYSG